MMYGTTMKDIGEDDGIDMYVPFKQDGTFNPFRPKPPEELSETFKSERSFPKRTVTAPQRIRRLVSIAKGRELLRQRQSVEIGQPLLLGKKGEDGMVTGGLDAVKTDVDTEAEDSEVSVAEAYDDGRPTVLDTSSKKKEEQDGCRHFFISSTGPLRSADEPPDFLQLPEPIKQRTAGAARVAAAARAWAAASITTPAPAPGVFSGWQQAGAAGQPNQDIMLPPTARGMPPPGNAAAAIAAELQRQNNFGNPQNDAFAAGAAANYQGPQAYQAQPGNQPIGESREVVAGPAVLALRRMRNRMSALAEGRLPWNFSRPSAQSQQAQSSQQAQPVQQIQQAQPVQPQQVQQIQQSGQHQQGQPALQQLPLQPQPPPQPQNGPRRPLLPNLGARSNAAASSNAVPALGPASAGAASSSASAAAASSGGGSGAASSPGPAAVASSGDGLTPATSPAAGSAAASDEPQMQSVVPAPPSQPKPPSSSGASRFWKRPWPKVNLSLNPLGWGGSSSGASSSNSPPAGSSAAASSSQGASSSRQGNGVQSQDATPSSAAACGVGSP